ncbi:ABC-three component system protein [Micromonospora sp. NPDC049102]|uniref:ABC-three component system protein n=1 Tax=Micromonospora sp. NPDC049102 TaxID=3364265 RepID=UPI0037129CA5
MPDTYPADSDLTELPVKPPGVALVVPPVQGPRFTPDAQLFIYTADEWEDFVLEWAYTLPGYHSIKRFGGANDHGVDIAGFVTPRGFEGDWDCFQCKRYKDVLMPSDAWPEIYKVLRYACDGYYTLPRTYTFMASRGPGPSLAQLVLRPASLKEDFLQELAEAKVGPAKNPAERERVAQYAESVDFSRFKALSIPELLRQHEKSPYHSIRFAMPLPAPPLPQRPPESPASDETPYLQQLFDVYEEKYGMSAACVSELAEHDAAFRHLTKQREYFYCAETFRIFYRDKVPAGTFEHLQSEVQEGVQEVHDDDHRSGYERLQAVLKQSQAINLTTNALISVWQARDKKGICHQLANEHRLRWRQ